MFNKGDKVLVTGHCYGGCSANVKKNYSEIIGMIGTVVEYQHTVGKGKCAFSIEGKPNPNANTGYYYLPDKYLELVDETKETTKTKVLFESEKQVLEFNGLDWLNSPIDTTTPAATITTKKEEEKTNMNKIKNEEVIKLYFERQNTQIKEEYEKKRNELIKTDSNHQFVKSLYDQFDAKLETLKGEIEASFEFTSKCQIDLPLTKETNEAMVELKKEYTKKFDELKGKETEVRAMLSGCETYMDEMVVLNSYGIVKYNKYGDEIEAKMI